MENIDVRLDLYRIYRLLIRAEAIGDRSVILQTIKDIVESLIDQLDTGTTSEPPSHTFRMTNVHPVREPVPPVPENKGNEKPEYNTYEDGFEPKLTCMDREV